MAVENTDSSLGVCPSAGLNEIKHAYRAQAKRMHPDVDKSPNASERFSRLSEAYREAIKRRELVNLTLNDMRERLASENSRKDAAAFADYVDELRSTRRPRRGLKKAAVVALRGVGVISLLTLIAVVFAEGLFPGSLSNAAAGLAEKLAEQGVNVNGLVAGIDTLLRPLRSILG